MDNGRREIHPGGAEERRLAEDGRREKNWKRWGPYLSERQWGTVREDYSADGSAWDHFPHDHARSRAYRWGEDGLLGICDRQCRLCFALALWNGQDPILKERLFGLTNGEGNHGEDVKECYFYLDSTPTHSFMKALYRYPQAAYPYAWLVEENRRRGRGEPEFELIDTGIFDDDRYFDVVAEYAKGSPNDILIRLTVANRGPEAATLHLLPTLWFRNTWSWGCRYEDCGVTGRITRAGDGSLRAEHPTLSAFRFWAEPAAGDGSPTFLFTENETNAARLYGGENRSPWVKDAFEAYVIRGDSGAVNPAGEGSKAAAYYRLDVPAEGEVTVRLRLSAEVEAPGEPFGAEFDRTFERRIAEADAFYAGRLPDGDEAARRVMRQAYAGLLWSKQFYHYSVSHWLEGDPAQPPPPPGRKQGRNSDWEHLFNRDVVSMPDKWEYPWYAAWDLAFHMIPFAEIDPQFAKEQLILFLREWYMHPNGQLPAYEFAFSDVNPPVHAWAAWRIYKMTGARHERDRVFLARVFQKLLLNFTWWVNRKDAEGRNLFGGGFLGMDNIGVFDRSQPLPPGERLDQADGTAWMAFYCATMLSMALELAREDPAYEDVASKFFEHFVAIIDAMATQGGSGLWHEEDGFYYDQLHFDGMQVPVRLRSLVGLVPMLAVEILEEEVLDRLPGFTRRMNWFLRNRPELARYTAYCTRGTGEGHGSQRLLSIPSRERLERLLRIMLDPEEFLSPHGIRSLSRRYAEQPYRFPVEDRGQEVRYVPGEADTGLFGGNSNWRGPIWLPLNYLIVEALERYYHFYGDDLRVECPVGSGERLTLREVADELERRLSGLFLPDRKGRSPWQGEDERWSRDPHWQDLVWFHEYFHGETGRGLGASHQTGWTALVTRFLGDVRRASGGRGEGGLG